MNPGTRLASAAVNGRNEGCLPSRSGPHDSPDPCLTELPRLPPGGERFLTLVMRVNYSDGSL